MKKLDFLPNLRNRYSIRRFTVGTASILIGSLLFLGHNGEAKAAENTNDNTVVEASKDTSTSQQKPVENPVPQENTINTTQQVENTPTSQNVLETVKTEALSKFSTFTHLTEETVKQYTAEVKQAQTEADVQAVVDKAQKAEAEAVKQAEVEQAKAVESTKEQSATTTEVPKSTTESVKEETKADTTSVRTSEPNKTSEAKAATPTIETTPLSTEQKVDKVKTELASDYDSSKVDAALAVIDTTDLTADQIKAEVLKLLLEQGSAQKDLYSPQATLLRSAQEAPTTVRAFSVDTSLKDDVVVTPENFNQYFNTNIDATYDQATGIATLTPDEKSKRGSISLDTKMNVDKDFRFVGKVNLGDKGEGHLKDGVPGGDGITFIFNSGNTNEIGLFGAAVGMGGLKNSFGFKLDTYITSGGDPKNKVLGDPVKFNGKSSYGAFVRTDGAGMLSVDGATAKALDAQPHDNQFQDFIIDYDGDTKNMTVTYGGQTWTKNMKTEIARTHKNVFALSIAASTGGAFNLQQVQIENFTYTASALLEQDFVDQDTQELIDKPIRTSGDVGQTYTIPSHDQYLQDRGYQLVSEDLSLAPNYNTATHAVKLTNASQFIVYYVKDVQAPVIGDVADTTVDVETEMTPLVLDITDNSKHFRSKTVTGLPEGVTFNEATNTISGTPTKVGTSTVTVTATDNAGLTATKTFQFTVADTIAPTITPVENKTTEAFTPIAPITISADDNSKAAPTLTVTGLPTGLTFDPTTKQITGTPTAEGTSTVTITATDAAQNPTTSTFDITVNPNAALEALKAAVADAKTVAKDDFTPNSVAALDAKVAEGEALLANPEKGSTDAFNAKTQEIKQAKDQLVRKADKTELEKAIAEAEKITNLDPNKPMDQQLKTALANAKTTDADLNATQQATDDSKNNLNHAIQEKLRADAYEKLQEAVKKGVEVASADGYTPNSVEAVKDTIKKVNPLVIASMSDDPAVREQYSVDQINEATKAINDSIAGLVKKADKSELQKAIDKAGTLGQLNASDTEDKAVQDALDKANQVKADGNATPQQVAEATDALNQAIDKKLYQDALDELNAVIKDAEAVKKDNYTPETVTPFEAAITDGKAKAADTNATPEQLKAAAEAIKTAKDALKQKANKVELEKSIATAEALPPLKAGDPEDDAVKAALDKAKQVDANQNADQAAVDAAKAALDDAINAKKAQDAKEANDAAAAKQAALDALKDELAKVAKLDKDSFTPNSVAPLNEKETDGKAIVANPDNKTTEEIEAATQALKDAQKGLVAKADKAELQKAIDKAKGLGQLDPADKEDKAVQDALTKAEQVNADGNATEQQVADATKALNDAVAAKERQDALDELQKALDAANAVKKDDYKPSTVTPFEAAVQAGEAAKADTSKTPQELKEAAQAIKDAQNALQAKANKAELEKSIQTAEGLGQLDANDPEDKAVQDALAKAKEVDQDPNATQEAVDAAKAALDDAINAKKAQDAKEANDAAAAKQAALDALKDELAKVAKLDKDSFTPNSVAPLNEKETDGKAIVANPDNKTTEEIEAATQALKDAQKDLVKKADKTGLENSIQEAEGLGQLDANDPEDKAVQDALAKAKEVDQDPNATQEAVDAAKEALDNAINAKKAQDAKEAKEAADAKQAALDALKAELDKAAKVDKNNYTPDSVKPLTDAQTAGQAIVDAPENKTTEEIEKATQALKDAQAGLVAKADKAELEKAITAAEGLTLDPNDKEDKAVQDALAKAKEVQANPNATQDEVNAAKDALNKAIEAKTAQDQADAVKAALDALKAELEKAKAVQTDKFTPDSVKPLTDAETAGQAIVDAPTGKTVEEINKATQDLKDAQAGLVAKANKAELEKSIATAEGLGQLDPADKEDKAVQDALAAAKAVEQNPNATQTEVDNAKAALDEAINAKKAQDAKEAKEAADAKQAALDALKAELEKAKAVNKDDYTPDSVKPLTDAQTAGQEIVDAPDNKTTEEIEAATQALKDAQKDLVKKADKAELEKSIQTAEGLDQLDANDPEDKAVQDALAKAKEVDQDPNATQEAVDAAKAALDNAINAKKDQDAKDAVNAALDALKAELDKAAKVDKNNFTPDSVKPLTDAQTAGQAIVDAPTGKTVEEIEAATQALKDAQKGLVAKADKSELDNAIKVAEDLGQLDPSDAEDKAVQDALEKAKKVQANPNATQAEVDAAKEALDNAINAKKAQDAKDKQALADAKQAALDALKAELEKAKGIDTDLYTPNSVKPLTDSEVVAQNILDYPENKTIEAIKAATQALKDAQKGLINQANKENLFKAVVVAENLKLDPTDAEDKAVQEALVKAKEVLKDANATQYEVDAATEALNKAIESKNTQDAKDAAAKQAALDALKAELEKAKAINKDAYTPNSVKPLTEAETAGQAIVDAPTGKTVEEIEAATQALKDAQAGLVAKADKAELQKAIDNANALGNLDATDKEDKAVQEAVAAGETVKADGNATPQQVAEATKAINDAIAAKAHQDALDELQKAIDKAQSTDRTQYTPESVKNLDNSVNNGKAIVENSKEVSIKDIQDATKAIEDSLKALEAVKAPKTEKVTEEVKPTTGKSVERKSDKAVKPSEGSKAQTKANKAKVLPNTGQETPADPKYATLMFAIGGLMTLFGRRKKEDKDNTEK